MTCDEAMAKLKACGNSMMFKHNQKVGAGDDQFGCNKVDIRKIAKEIKHDPKLANELWNTGNLDAMILATLIMKPKDLSLADVERMVGSSKFSPVLDYLGSNLVKAHPEKDTHREKWMNSKDNMTARMGWSLTRERVSKKPEGLDAKALLERIEAEMGTVPEPVQWNMNHTLVEIALQYPELRDRALAIAEKLGVYRDYPVSKGCVSPFAPVWIEYMVNPKK